MPSYQMESEKNGQINKAFDGSVVDIQEKSKPDEDKNDPWKVAELDQDYVPWKELDSCGRVKRVAHYLATPILVLGLLYLFICSLDFLSSAFKLLGGRTAGSIFRQNEIFSNPLAGLMMGVLVTVLVQSSSTSTSIIISMVGANLLDIQTAIPMVMGANIGTSVTNTIVSLGQVKQKDEFRRAFAGATVHDMFNWLTVIVLLPLEIVSGYLFRLSEAIITSLRPGQNKDADKDLLKVITTPFTKLIIEVNKNVITDIATGELDITKDSATMMKLCKDKKTPPDCCKSKWEDYMNSTAFTNTSVAADFCASLNSCLKKSGPATEGCLNYGWQTVNGTMNFSCARWTHNETDCIEPTSYLFRGLHYHMSDEAIGGILLVASLALLCICLVFIVKSLSSVLKGPMAAAIKKFVNAEFPGKARYFTGYLAILLGCGMTILVQSSSIFTSTLTPLVGMGVVELHRMYPLTLGSNIGTTITGILAALAQDADTLNASLQVAFCHLFFNISGIILFYPIPFMRWPIPLAKFLGNTTAKYRWFALVYIICMFFIFPAAVFALSIPGWYVMVGVLGPFVLLAIVIGIIKCIQAKRPSCLPPKMRTWKWLPLPLRSLQPYDSVMQKVMCGCGCCKGKRAPTGAVSSSNGDVESKPNGTAYQNTETMDTRF